MNTERIPSPCMQIKLPSMVWETFMAQNRRLMMATNKFLVTVYSALYFCVMLDIVYCRVREFSAVVCGVAKSCGVNQHNNQHVQIPIRCRKCLQLTGDSREDHRSTSSSNCQMSPSLNTVCFCFGLFD